MVNSYLFSFRIPGLHPPYVFICICMYFYIYIYILSVWNFSDHNRCSLAITIAVTHVVLLFCLVSVAIFVPGAFIHRLAAPTCHGPLAWIPDPPWQGQSWQGQSWQGQNWQGRNWQRPVFSDCCHVGVLCQPCRVQFGGGLCHVSVLFCGSGVFRRIWRLRRLALRRRRGLRWVLEMPSGQ